MLTSESTPMTVFVPTTDAFLQLTTSNKTFQLLNNETAFHGDYSQSLHRSVTQLQATNPKRIPKNPSSDW